MIIIKKAEKDSEKRYNVATVSQAIGRSEGSISGFFSNRRITTKGGITLSQIVDVIESDVRGKVINWKDVEEIRNRLKVEKGYEITEIPDHE